MSAQGFNASLHPHFRPRSVPYLKDFDDAEADIAAIKQSIAHGNLPMPYDMVASNSDDAKFSRHFKRS